MKNHKIAVKDIETLIEKKKRLFADKENAEIELNDLEKGKNDLIKKYGGPLDVFPKNIASDKSKIENSIERVKKKLFIINNNLYGTLSGKNEGLVWKIERLTRNYKKQSINNEQEFQNIESDYIDQLNQDFKNKVSAYLEVNSIQLNEIEMDELFLEIQKNYIKRLEEIDQGKISDDKAQLEEIQKAFNKRYPSTNVEMKQLFTNQVNPIQSEPLKVIVERILEVNKKKILEELPLKQHRQNKRWKLSVGQVYTIYFERDYQHQNRKDSIIRHIKMFRSLNDKKNK